MSIDVQKFEPARVIQYIKCRTHTAHACSSPCFGISGQVVKSLAFVAHCAPSYDKGGSALQVAEIAYVPTPFQPTAAALRRNPPLTNYNPVHQARPPATWSLEECFYRTGAFGGPHILNSQPSDLGGTHIRRRLRNYAMDWSSQARCPTTDCVKHKANIRGLGPGLMVCVNSLISVKRLDALLY